MCAEPVKETFFDLCARLGQRGVVRLLKEQVPLTTVHRAYRNRLHPPPKALLDALEAEVPNFDRGATLIEWDRLCREAADARPTKSRKTA